MFAGWLSLENWWKKVERSTQVQRWVCSKLEFWAGQTNFFSFTIGLGIFAMTNAQAKPGQTKEKKIKQNITFIHKISLHEDLTILIRFPGKSLRTFCGRSCRRINRIWVQTRFYCRSVLDRFISGIFAWNIQMPWMDFRNRLLLLLILILLILFFFFFFCTKQRKNYCDCSGCLWLLLLLLMNFIVFSRLPSPTFRLNFSYNYIFIIIIIIWKYKLNLT